jgi:uncharacterized membrane protein YfcA
MPSAATAAVVVVICFVSTLLYVLSSFGNAILFHLLWQVCAAGDSNVCSGNVAEAVLYITISTLCSTAIQTYLCRSYINWPLAVQIALGQILGGLFGTLLLFTVTSVWIVRSLGLFFVLIAIQSIIREANLAVAADINRQDAAVAQEEEETVNPMQTSLQHKPSEDAISLHVLEEANSSVVVSPMMELCLRVESPNQCDKYVSFPNAARVEDMEISPTVNDETCADGVTDVVTATVDHVSEGSYKVNTWERRATVWAVGVSAGFLGGLFGTGGPPLMMFVTHVKLPKNISRGTLSVGFCAISLERLFLFLVYPPSGLKVHSPDKVFMYFLIILATLSSIYLGEKIVKYVSDVHFRRLIMCILSTGSIMMSTSGTSITIQASLCAVSLVIFGLVGLGAYKYYYKSVTGQFAQVGLPQSATIEEPHISGSNGVYLRSYLTKPGRNWSVRSIL